MIDIKDASCGHSVTVQLPLIYTQTVASFTKYLF